MGSEPTNIIDGGPIVAKARELFVVISSEPKDAALSALSTLNGLDYVYTAFAMRFPSAAEYVAVHRSPLKSAAVLTVEFDRIMETYAVMRDVMYGAAERYEQRFGMN